MKHLDLFSGIGGFSLAARWVWGEEHEPIFCEIDKFCQKVLRKHWPIAKIFTDIKELTYEQIVADTGSEGGQQERGRQSDKRETPSKLASCGKNGRSGTTTKPQSTIDLLTGGFPCQPFSVAGKRQGEADDRYLWPEMLRIISEVKPRWVIGENVTGILNMGFDDMLADLEAEGYEVETLVLPACAVGARHRRDRVWIVANAGGNGLQGKRNRRNIGSQARNDKGCQVARTNSKIRPNWWAVEPDVGRVAHGIPQRVDRLKGLGNAIVPQVAQIIMQAIKEIDEVLDLA